MVINNKVNREAKHLATILFSAFLITLLIIPTVTDPINSPKLWALLVVSGWILPTIFENIKTRFNQKEIKYFYVMLFLLSIALVISALFSDNKFRAIFGEAQRKNGVLTYIGFMILAAAASRVDISKHHPRFIFGMFFGTLLLSAYGSAQILGLDFVSWNNQYSPVIGTLGNPNFMGALMGVLSLLLVPALFLKIFTLRIKLTVLALLLMNLIVIYFTRASQGMLIFLFGSALYLVCLVYTKNKRAGTAGLFVLLLGAGVSLLGILQKGPLSEFLYKDSIRLRGYYWDAGIKMFLEKPFFGVGLDNYGSYFNQVRDLSYPLNYGYFVTSNNAHNLPIQLFATGGAFVGLLYMALVIFVFSTVTKKLRIANQEQRIILFGLGISYLIFQLQSLVSIDNIGVGVWGWVIAGLIIGFTATINPDNFSGISSPKQIKTKSRESESTSLFSWVFTILAVTLVALLYQGEKKPYDLEGYLIGSSGVTPEILSITKTTLNTPLMEPSYKLRIADQLISRGLTEEPMQILTDLIKHEPGNLDYLTVRASYADYLGNVDLAILDRIEITKLNPYNAFNYKVLSDLYLKSKQPEQIKLILDKVEAFAPGTDIVDEIKKNLNNAEMS